MIPFLLNIRSHPLYLRENGRWGQANKYYQAISRYLWLLIFALPVAFLFNIFSPTNFLGGDQFMGLFVLTCLPGLVIQAINWIGIILAPALTAPAIVEERITGTWEILRLTPMPVHEIVLAKMAGGLMRMKLWLPLAIVSGIQMLAAGFGVIAFSISNTTGNGVIELMSGIFGTFGLILRPWIEIIFAGVVGITISLWAKSVRSALVSSYAIILFVKLILINGLSLVIGFSLLATSTSSGLPFATLALSLPVVLYTLLIVGLIWLIKRRAKRLEGV